MMRFAALRMATLFLIAIFAMAMCPEQAWLGAPAKAVAQDDNPFGDLTKTVAQDDSPFEEPVKAVAKDGVVANSVTIVCRTAAPSAATLADDLIREKLSAKGNFNFDQAPYLDIAENLQQQLGVNIILTASATDDALTEDEPFTCNLSGITYANALRIMLLDKNATYCIQGGVIKILSLDEAEDGKWCARRMIDVSETLEMIRVAEKDRIGKPKPGQIIPDARSGGGGGVFAVQTAGPAAAKPAVEAKDIQQLANAIVQAVKNSQPEVQRSVELVTAESILIDAITETVFEEVWDSGDRRIVCVGGVLIVNAPEEANEKVASFIEDLTFNMPAAKRR